MAIGFQCVVPCTVQLLPKNSAILRYMRAYQRYRFMIDLNCMTGDRMDRLKIYIKKYKDACQVDVKFRYTSLLSSLTAQCSGRFSRIRKRLRISKTTLGQPRN